MFLHRTKDWWDKAIDRAERTMAQTWASTLPAGLVITSNMIKEANLDLVLVILAWVLTGFLGAFSSLITSYAKGIPESDDQKLTS
jgi:hypothetical protein